MMCGDPMLDPIRQMRPVFEHREHFGDWNLDDFVTPIASGFDDCEPEPYPKLSPDVQAELDRKLDDLAMHRAEALVRSMTYIVR